MSQKIKQPTQPASDAIWITQLDETAAALGGVRVETAEDRPSVETVEKVKIKKQRAKKGRKR